MIWCIWKSNHIPKQSTVFCCIDYDHVDKGLQVAIEPSSVGDKIRKVIKDTVESEGTEEGFIVNNPYCIQLDIDESIKGFDKYVGRKIAKNRITPEIKELLAKDPPDLSYLLEPFDPAALRVMMEDAALIDLPFDEIFGSAKAPSTKHNVEQHKPAAPKTAPVSKPVEQPAKKAAPVAPPQEDTVECDDCGKPMRMTDASCPHCGKVYEEPAPPPVKRTRSSVKAAPPSREPGDDSDEDDSDVPF
jgi:hypothetical protein